MQSQVHLGPTWTNFGLTLANLGRTWDQLSANLDSLGATLGQIWVKLAPLSWIWALRGGKGSKEGQLEENIRQLRPMLGPPLGKSRFPQEAP